MALRPWVLRSIADGRLRYNPSVLTQIVTLDPDPDARVRNIFIRDIQAFSDTLMCVVQHACPAYKQLSTVREYEDAL